MKKYFALAGLAIAVASCDFSDYILEQDYDFTTTFEKSGGTETATYQQVIDFYEDLAAVYSEVSLETVGETDSGEPLHLALFNPGGDFDISQLRQTKTIMLILNGIHPGESDGIDATMMLFRDLAQDSIVVPENVVIATIPVYNVGGALNRNSFTRTNQNGPKSYGFRGNARNYDLNRDFIKADTRNTRSFYEIFHRLNPDVLIDTHVSNGADYQYTLTHLFTQHNKLGGEPGKYLNQSLMPALVDSLGQKGLEITPYVNVFNEVPEKGFSQFLDTPRYSTGYAALWNTFGMMIETHMLKPYPKRVWGTYELLRSMIGLVDHEAEKIRRLRSEAVLEFPKESNCAFDFEVDSTRSSTLEFLGYHAEIVESEVTGLERLQYDTTKPFKKEIVYYDQFKPTKEVAVPRAYVVRQAWWPVLEILKLNGVEMKEFSKDTLIAAEVYRIEDYKTRNRAYEGHYPHYDTRVSSSRQKIRVEKGDFLISLDQPAARYLMSTLEPEAPDSFFNWNFFDSILQQKEGFSPYVFEDIAREILDDYPALEEEFLAKREKDPNFASDAYAQLEWIHRRSEHYETAHLRYPVFRILR